MVPVNSRAHADAFSSLDQPLRSSECFVCHVPETAMISGRARPASMPQSWARRLRCVRLVVSAPGTRPDMQFVHCSLSRAVAFASSMARSRSDACLRLLRRVARLLLDPCPEPRTSLPPPSVTDRYRAGKRSCSSLTPRPGRAYGRQGTWQDILRAGGKREFRVALLETVANQHQLLVYLIWALAACDTAELGVKRNDERTC